MEKQTLFDKLESFNEQLNLTHYWIIFLKYKKIILGLPIFFALLGYFIALNILPIFQSTATLVIEQQEKKIVDIEEVYASDGTTGFGNSANHINNQIQIIKSDEIISGILANEKTANKIANMYSSIPDKFVTRNMKAIKNLIFFETKKDNVGKGNLSNEKRLKG